jgi:hypothetical protein
MLLSGWSACAVSGAARRPRTNAEAVAAAGFGAVGCGGCTHVAALLAQARPPKSAGRLGGHRFAAARAQRVAFGMAADGTVL